MSWKRRAREGAYHHGNLREALIQAARELIKEKGPGGFTFADAARSAGVGRAARRRRDTGGRPARQPAATRDDDEPASLVDGARHRLAVRPRRCRAAHAPHDGRGTARVGDADLPAGTGVSPKSLRGP